MYELPTFRGEGVKDTRAEHIATKGVGASEASSTYYPGALPQGPILAPYGETRLPGQGSHQKVQCHLSLNS
jgi:hypothetical protein